MYYSYDGMRNVTELTDRHGDSIEQYRYDAFGGLYTGVTAPYNTNSFAGKSYDAKVNLIDMNARWYGAQNGRFTTADPYTGDILTPYTQNRYAYVGNNPINRWDPLGYWESGDSGLSSAAQADIKYLTDLYYATEDERASIHEAANEIRKEDSNVYAMVIGGLIGIDDLVKMGRLGNISDVAVGASKSIKVGELDLLPQNAKHIFNKYDSNGW